VALEQGQTLPHTLGISEETVIRNMASDDVREALDINKKAHQPQSEMTATVHLGNGTTFDASLPVDTCERVFRDARKPDTPWGMWVY